MATIEANHRWHPLKTWLTLFNPILELQPQILTRLDGIRAVENVPAKIRALLLLLKNYHLPTAYHCKAVATHAYELAQLSGLEDHDSRLIYVAGLIHDIGKLSVPVGILSRGKEPPLTKEEYYALILHGRIGGLILSYVHLPQLAVFSTGHHLGNSKINHHDENSRSHHPFMPFISIWDSVAAAMDPKRIYAVPKFSDVILAEIDEKFNQGTFPPRLRIPFHRQIQSGQRPSDADMFRRRLSAASLEDGADTI